MSTPPSQAAHPRPRWWVRATLATALVLGVASFDAPHVGADEHTEGGWTTDVDVVASAHPGDTVTFTVTVTADEAETAVVELEVWNQDPTSDRWLRPVQQVWSPAAFTAGVPRTFTMTWDVPADEPAGTHLVKVGVFSTRWSSQYHWNDTAGRVQIVGGGHEPPATTTTAPSTTAPSTTAPPSPTTSTVPPTTITAPPPPTTSPPSSWAYVDGFDDLAGWTASRWRAAPSSELGYVGPANGVCGRDGVLPPDDVQLCDGAVTVAAASQNYGDTLIRARQPFAGDTLEVSMTLAPNDRLAGWPQIVLTADPMVAPSYYSGNGKAATPRNGLAISFNNVCDGHVAPELVRWTEFKESIDQGTGCGRVGALTALTRIRVELAGSVRVYADDVLLKTFSGPGVGQWYVHLGAHNHASLKYVGVASVNATFDDLRFDGPVVPATGVAAAPDAAVRTGAGIEIAYGLPTTLTVRDVPATRRSAWLLASMMVDQSVDWSTLRLGYRLNGGATHEVGLTPAEVAIRTSGAGHSGSLSWSIPIDPAELVAGANTVTLTTNARTSVDPPFVGNVEIVTAGGSTPIPPPPTSTTTTSTTTTSSTTTSTSTTTTVPSTTTQPPSTTAPPATSAPTTSTPPATTVPPPAPAGSRLLFSEDFVDPGSVNRFVYQRIHGSANSQEGTPAGTEADILADTWHGDHDMSCSDPNLTLRGPLGFEPTTPPMVSFERINATVMGKPNNQSVWYCAPANDPARAHLMTAFDSPAYGHVDFMPNQTFDNVSRVCFDVSWNDLGGRKWIQVAIVPEDYFQAGNRRMSFARPDFEGDGNVAARAELVRNGMFMYDSFRSFIAAYTGTATGVQRSVTFGNGFIDSSRFNDKAPRFTQCLEDLGNGNVRITRNFPAALGGSGTYTLAGRFPDGPARVIFQDVTYDGAKGDSAADTKVTWHWDNIHIYGN